MTDTEQKRIKAICKEAHVDDISDLSDGYHTFKQLYYQRMMLFAALVRQNRDKAWKSLRHEDGELCFGGGWFIVGIDTPEGSYTYHYEDNFFSLFDCEELERGKPWDGHTEKDVTRLLSLEQEPCEMTAEEYRQRMIQAFHNADTDELIAVCVLPTEKEFEHLEWLLKNHYKKESGDDVISRQAVLDMWRQEICYGRTCHARDEGRCTETFCDFKLFEYKINHMLPVKQEPKWIPVSERLPETNDDVLDKIRSELHATAELHDDGDYYLRDEWVDEIFDKYKAESEA